MPRASGPMRCPCRTSRARCSRLGWTLAFVAAMAAPVAAATITVSVRRAAQRIEVQASTTLHADVATAWRVLSGCARCAEFIADLPCSRVVARRRGQPARAHQPPCAPRCASNTVASNQPHDGAIASLSNGHAASIRSRQ